MSDSLFVLRPDDPDWDRWITRAPHDFHHLAAYHALAEDQGEGAAKLAVFGTRERFMAWPYLVRGIRDDLQDATSVYGYSGPTGLNLDDDAFCERAWGAFRNAWCDDSIVTLFTRCHPILGNQHFCGRLHGAEIPEGGELFEFGRSVSIDLRLDIDTRRAGYRQSFRQAIKRAENEGLTVALDESLHQFDGFAALYRETMRKNGASDLYFFSDDYFAALRRALGCRLYLTTATMGTDLVGGLLLVVNGDIATAHLTGSDPALSRLSPLKLLIDKTCDIAAGLGALHLHLGAGRGGMEDNLFSFKKRFSKIRHSFVAGRWILDADANRQLIAQRGEVPEGRGFFPIYRVPPDRKTGVA